MIYCLTREREPDGNPGRYILTRHEPRVSQGRVYPYVSKDGKVAEPIWIRWLCEDGVVALFGEDAKLDPLMTRRVELNGSVLPGEPKLLRGVVRF